MVSEFLSKSWQSPCLGLLIGHSVPLSDCAWDKRLHVGPSETIIASANLIVCMDVKIYLGPLSLLKRELHA